MNLQILRLVKSGNLILLLGAGASADSINKLGAPIPTSRELAEVLAQESGMEFANESLDVVYSAAVSILGSNRVWTILEQQLGHCTPSLSYRLLAQYPWLRIYTLNIDDAFEQALGQGSPQNVNILQRSAPLEDKDQLYQRLDYIKLNGCIKHKNNGVVFSAQEYGREASSAPTWYSELARDFFHAPFLFVGTTLHEPLFYQQIERFRSLSGSIEPTSYILTPRISEIERAHLKTIKLEHINGTLSDFSDYLQKHLKPPPQPRELAFNRRPELRVILDGIGGADRGQYISTLKNVTLVSRSVLDRSLRGESEEGQIRDFYKGFKPRWKDILDEVPARLSFHQSFLAEFDDLGGLGQLVVVFGPAGCGKTTLLMQSALILQERFGLNSYFLENPVDNLEEIVKALDLANNRKYFLFSDSLDLVADQVERILQQASSLNCIFVCSERQHIWESRVSQKLNTLRAKTFEVPLIVDADADHILEKLERFGPWTRLRRMSQTLRVEELVRRSRRQLLIGLLETTKGEGFERIIKSEFDEITDFNCRRFVLTAGLATMHRRPISISLLARALNRQEINENPTGLVRKLAGIAHLKNGSVWIRHPVYIRELFNNLAASDEVFHAVTSLLWALSAYKAPVMRYASKSDGIIFKSIINHRFLRETFGDLSEKITEVYRRFETVFNVDGLFWLQYGLALRDRGDHAGALEKLKTAYEAYPMLHTEHALAQQLLILALRSSNHNEAIRQMTEAKEILSKLDSTMESDDTYPIVTLSEGHTQVVLKFEGTEKARDVAKHYLILFQERFRNNSKPKRVYEAELKLTKFSVSGNWPGLEE